MTTVLTEFVGILVSGIVDMATGIASGVTAMAEALFLTKSEAGAITGLSAFGGILAVFCGISLCVGITSKVYIWVTQLGK